MSRAVPRFHIQAVPTIFVLIVVPLFLALGLWQLDRAKQKRALAASLEMRRKLPPLQLSGQIPDVAQLEFRKVIAEGRLLDERTILIENRKHLGSGGFHVITPLRTATGEIVLVNRGWIAAQGRDQAPAIPAAETNGVISGEVRVPQPPALQLQLEDVQAQQPPRWPFLTLEHYAAWSGLAILPFVILQDHDADSGFIRQWPEPRVNDAMHIGYAVQWFAFALIALLIWLFLSLRRRPAATEVL
jgi:surfeit locus 1 family protein